VITETRLCPHCDGTGLVPYAVYGEGEERTLVDPDCRAARHHSCPGPPCGCYCHDNATSPLVRRI